MNINYIVTGSSATVYTITDDGDSAVHTVPSSWQHYAELVDTLLYGDLHDEDDQESVLALLRLYDPSILSRSFTVDEEVSLDDIRVTDRAVFYKGQQVTHALARRLLDVRRDGLPLDPWLKFMAKVYENPAEWARGELFEWMERSDLPLTEDGDFLAFKRVRYVEDDDMDTWPTGHLGAPTRYLDIHSGTMDNTPGLVVEMPREEVDTQRAHTCSTGLHFASKNYLGKGWGHGGFGGRGDGVRTLLLKVNPADVVSIPQDYDCSKGRTWRYEVLQAVPSDVELVDFVDPVINTPDPGDDWVQIVQKTEGGGYEVTSTKKSIFQRARNWWANRK